MSVSIVLDLPPFDTGQYEGCDFKMFDGEATLTLRVTDMPLLSIRFNKVRWHQFTALYNCTPQMIKDAYFRLVVYRNSSAVATFIEQDSSSCKAYSELNHYRIFLDETGCHEVFAESATTL